MDLHDGITVMKSAEEIMSYENHLMVYDGKTCSLTAMEGALLVHAPQVADSTSFITGIPSQER